MKITFDIELADYNYGRLYINATTTEELNKLVDFFRESIDSLPYGKDKQVEQEI